MAKQKQDDQPELTYSSYVRTQDVTQKTCRRQWTIGKSGKRGSRISVLAARLDDDDDDNKGYFWMEFLGLQYTKLCMITLPFLNLAIVRFPKWHQTTKKGESSCPSQFGWKQLPPTLYSLDLAPPLISTRLVPSKNFCREQSFQVVMKWRALWTNG